MRQHIFGVARNIIILVCWKLNGLSSSERILKNEKQKQRRSETARVTIVLLIQSVVSGDGMECGRGQNLKILRGWDGDGDYNDGEGWRRGQKCFPVQLSSMWDVCLSSRLLYSECGETNSTVRACNLSAANCELLLNRTGCVRDLHFDADVSVVYWIESNAIMSYQLVGRRVQFLQFVSLWFLIVRRTKFRQRGKVKIIWKARGCWTFWVYSCIRFGPGQKSHNFTKCIYL